MRASVDILARDDNGETYDLTVRAEWAICCECAGHGRSSAHLGAITGSEWADWDIEEREDYMRGAYDKTCAHCNGTGKVLAADYAALTPEQLADVDRYESGEASFERECRDERRWGA